MNSVHLRVNAWQVGESLTSKRYVKKLLLGHMMLTQLNGALIGK